MKSPAPRFLGVLLGASLSLLAAQPLGAQTATEPNEGLRLVADPATPHAYAVSWWGRAGHTYFLQQSEDLRESWTYLPLIEVGQDAPLAYGFSHPGARVFMRVIFIDELFTDPFAADPDTDGLSNQEELGLNTHPLLPDSDGDGVPDGLDAFPNDATRHTFTGSLTVTLLSPPHAVEL